MESVDSSIHSKDQCTVPGLTVSVHVS